MLLLSALAGCTANVAQPPIATPTAPVKPEHPPLSLVPWPAHLVMRAGSFTVRDGAAVQYDKSDPKVAWVAHYLVELVRKSRDLSLAASDKAGVIRFRRLSGADSTGKEGYRLEISPDGITISASRTAGLFYGAVTLWQLMTQTAGGAKSITLPALAIDDAPRFAWRGLLLDSVRHYQTPAFVKSFVDAMALEKLNVLQWHLTDDQGWRLQIKRYPRLTQIGAWRVPAGAAAQADIDPKTGKPRLYGGFYTQKQVREIVAYAAARNVTIVPEIEMPGHAEAAIVAYPWLASVPNPPTQVSSDWGVFPYLYNPDERTFRFLENVLTEVMALFPGTYIHVGGDEAVKDQWKASPAIQQKIHEIGLKDEDALQSWFIARIGQFLEAHHRKLIGWDEILQGGIPPDATITSWRGIAGAVTAAKAGHDAVLSPAPVLYFDNRQAEGPGEPSGRAQIETLGDVYAFDPEPASLSDEQRQHIIGVQANIWTEHIREQDNVDYAAFPRAAALAELGWSPALDHDWSDFRTRMPAELARYTAMDLPHADHLLPAGAHDAPRPVDPFTRDSHELDLCKRSIALSIEGPAPLSGKRPVFLTDVLDPCWIWRKVDLTGVAGVGVSAGELPFNFQIGKDIEKVAKRPAATPDGEFEVHLDTCDGARIADLPMPHPGPDTALSTVQGALAPQSGVHDLCFVFTRPTLDPYWALHTVTLVPEH
ncbi:MAG TPA: family 20 glycosylhydrolase [Rhizomicrobium sp.]|nr:family 20 glycosylhydrolase [Rhizomicrobium sp.]